MFCYLLAASCFFLMPLSSAESALHLHTASYVVQISVVRGEMNTSLTAEDSVYTGTTHVRARGWARVFAKGTIEGRSSFEIANNELRTSNYYQRDTISGGEELTELTFNWKTGMLEGALSRQEGRERVELTVAETLNGDAYDPISLQYALMYDLQNGRLKNNYVLADGEEFKTINITRMEPSRIVVPFGEFDVIPVQHQAQSSSRITTFWFAPELDYLPVRIEQYKGDKRKMLAVLGDYQKLVTEQQ